ncbi:MAG TPA: cytochrome C1 [Casimicrobiaceae bacterium]|nr:cytochrome C1 [Casimicrobiaceae bacterium]
MTTRSGLLIALALFAQGVSADRSAIGDAENGRLLLRQFGCGTCHRIPGVAAAEGNVGPPLDAIARRVYLAGILPNTPANMVRWIRSPQSIDAKTAMPDLNVTEAHARDMTAYLYRLR